MSHRFDQRDKDRFAKDIFFGTMMEKYFMEKFVEQPQVNVISYEDNGADNTGEFIESGRTAGADYKATFEYGKLTYTDLLLEIKWVPTAGKLTLKVGDIKAYIREKANILFVLNTETPSFRRPTDYDYEALQDQIERFAPQIKWGIMFEKTVVNLLDWYEIKRIPYMGYKPGIVIPAEDFPGLFKVEQWELECRN